MQRRTLTLPPDREAELRHARDHDRRAYIREGAAALLKIAAGWSAWRVAREGLHRPRKPETVYRWLNAYQARGLAGLAHRPRGHRGLSPPAGRAGG
jgi:Winged helix-turn helix